MAKCATCGKPQYARCEGGNIEYVSGFFPCSRNPNGAARILQPVDEWTVLPEPTGEGLEDLLA